MKRIAVLLLILSLVPFARAGLRLGGGIHYWRTIEDIEQEEKFDEDGVAWVVSLQLCPAPLWRIEADLEIFPDGFGNQPDTTYAPQAYLIVGNWLYAAAGIGINYADGDFAEDPFHVLRAGLDLPIIQDRLHLDLYGRYQFMEWDDIDVDTDTVIFGVAARVAL